MEIFDIIALLIFFSGLFIFINSFYLKLPSSIGLMILAMTLSVMVLLVGLLFPELHLAKHVAEYDFSEVLSQFVISVMLFAGALNLNFSKLGRQQVSVVVLAVCGVILSTFIIGILVYGLLHFVDIPMDFMGCLVFGALISSTDPIAVTKTIRRYSLSDDLEKKISGESLLNSAIAVVLALTLVNVHKEVTMYDRPFDFFETCWIFIRDLGGGLVLGAFFGWIGYRVLLYIDNDSTQVEVLITLALVMTGSLVAEYLFVSSKMVAVVSGLMLGNLGKSRTSENAIGAYVFKFWRLIEETLAAMLFVLIGFEMLLIPLRADYLAVGFFTIVIVMLSRWLSVLIPIKALSQSRTFDNGTVSVLVWGSLRGGLPIAVALSLSGFPGQDLIITMTYLVVLTSILYQGFTLDVLMKMYQEKQLSKQTA